MTSPITDRLNKRMATVALSEFAADDCVIESDAAGPRLWEIAKKGLTVGLAAMTLLTSPYNAVAQSVPEMPEMPGREISEQFIADVARSVENVGKLGGMKLSESYSISAKLEDGNLAPESWGIRLPEPIFTRKTCLATYSAGKDAGAIYRLATKVGADFDIGRYEEMKAASFCAIWSSMPKFTVKAYHETDLGLSVISDVVTALGTAKYDTARFDDVYDLQTAIALSALRSGSEHEQGGALVRLGALRTAADYLATKEGVANISSASVEDLVDVSHILIKQAQGEIVRSGADIREIAAIGTGELPAALRQAGLSAAAKAVEDVRESGLSAEKDYFPSTTRSTCENISRGTQRRERRAKSLCRLFEAHGWQVEDGATFVGDFADYANARLSQTQAQVQAPQFAR